MPASYRCEKCDARLRPRTRPRLQCPHCGGFVFFPDSALPDGPRRWLAVRLFARRRQIIPVVVSSVSVAFLVSIGSFSDSGSDPQPSASQPYRFAVDSVPPVAPDTTVHDDIRTAHATPSH